jgi:tRNA dimethylallyltransferase
MHTAPPRALVLTGPTASGKTAVALALAEVQPLEVISMDSALVYRGMDIGTAKPTTAERAAVQHHLLDIRDPSQAYSAAEFVQDAQRLIAEVSARGRLPLLVGGTPMYLKALMEGLDALPPAQPALRAAIAAQAQTLGWPAMHERLQALDPVTAARLSPNDSQRIARALEVHAATGQPLSALQTRAAGTEHSSLQASQPVAAIVSLEPTDRAWLHQRIEQRLRAMLDAGFLDEVRALRARGDLHADLPAMRCVGYRQAWAALDAGGDESRVRAATEQTATAATRQLAKRQLTWLRGMPQRISVACDQAHAHRAAVKQLLALVEQQQP